MPRIVATNFDAVCSCAETVNLVVRSELSLDNAFLAFGLMRHVVQDAVEVHPVQLSLAE